MKKKSGKGSDEPRGGSRRRQGPAINRRGIKRDEDTSQLLERGEEPGADEVIDPAVDSPSEITSEGGPGTDASDRFGGSGRLSGSREPPNSRIRGSEAGYSTLGGGVYPDEGAEDDAPSYGDWQRHSSGATSGARGQEGLGFPGEHTWGEEQYTAERREEQGRSRGPRARRRPDESLARELHEILTNDPELDATEIEVVVEGGAVTLRGEVGDSHAKLLAEELIDTVPGVREVHNQLRVAR